jgi:hypothetical protein
VAALLAASSGLARAQTMLDQEERLIQIHSLLIDLAPANAPGTYRWGDLSLGLEVVTVPDIDGTTGSKTQITASDLVHAYPRPRVALGLPAPEGFGTFVGLSYIPPLEIERITVNSLAGEAGIAWLTGGFRLGLRAYAGVARTESPVTDPQTRDTLQVVDVGANLAAGYDVELGTVLLTPYAGAGLAHVSGDFTVTSDGAKLSSTYAGGTFHAGLRAFLFHHLEAVVEGELYPDRLANAHLRLAWVLDLGPTSPH